MFHSLISPGLFRRLSLLAIGILSATQAFAAPPDLTNGGVPDNTRTTNLGPTGMRGWVYHTNNGTRGDTSESRQIQVQIVAAGSPTAGILSAGDVILGADGTGASPVAFTSDARKSLAIAIADAESSTPATLKLLVWRAGTTSTMTITLRTMGAYSATAPYNCPKSAQILEEGLQFIMSSETAGSYSFGSIGLLAGNNSANPNNAARMSRVQTEARALVPNAATQAQLMSLVPDNISSKPTWARGHMLVFLSEYFLVTGDTQVLPAIRAFAVNIAKNQSLFGTMGHIYADPWPDGSLNGPMGGGYGVVNSAGMPCFLGLLLAKECGITDAEIDPAIAACSRFYAYYANKGVIPYGEHEPGFTSHENNGKSGLAALAFKLQPNRVSEARFYTQMATSSASEREVGHTGSFFNYLWAPLGAAAGGDEAAAAHFASIRWMLDLNRKWNGGFDYDCLNGEGPNSGSQYNDFRMSTAALLVYALPLRQLHITGRGANSSQWLTSTEVSVAAAADTYDATTRTGSQLVSDLGNWSPKVQYAAAHRLATLPLDSTTVNQIIALANDTNGTSRVGACIVLGKSTETSLVATRAATLAALLTDPQNHVRFMAAESMRYLNTTEKNAHLNTILAAAASTASPLFPLDEQDPMRMAHGRLAMLLFYNGGAYGPAGVLAGSNVTSAPKNLLYPAINAVASNPIGQCRSTLTSIYPYLTQTDLLAVADAIVDVVRDRAPADRMFSDGARVGGLQTFQKYGIAEGVPLSLDVMTDDSGTNDSVLAVLKLYAGSCNTVVPDPDVDAFCLDLISRQTNTSSAQQVLDAIAADTNPTPLTPLKSIQSVIADNPSLTLPNKWTTLRTTSNDYANGASVYTWRKVYGAGNVSFTPNGTVASKNTAVLFDGTPGQYLFEVKMTDSRDLTEVTSTVAVTLYQTGGTLPPNNPPVANNQSPTVSQAIATPITLTGSDPESLPLLYTLVSQPTNGTLTGSAPYLVYTSNYSYNGPDSFTFRVTDSEGQTSTATVSVSVTANNIFPTAIYEPFNYPAGVLNGVSGVSEVGFTGTWTANTTINVAAGSLAYGILPTLGSSIANLGGGNNTYGGRRLINASALASNGLLNDGATLWFSFVNGYSSTANATNARLGFALANSNFSTGGYQYYILNEGPQMGVGLGVTLGRFDGVNGKNVATLFRDSSFGTSGFSGNLYGTVPNTIIVAGQQRLVVGKITWGAASDTIELYEPDSNLNLGSAKSILTVNVNQSTFDTITFGRSDSVTLDEIRFGSNYASVLNGNAPMTVDTTAPTPSPLAFHQSPTVASISSISMVAVTAYDPNGVEYYFTCTAGGGHDSGWQSSPSYTDTGLTPGVLYSYTAKARDKSPARNETASSAASSATIPTQATLPDMVGMQQSAAESIITNLGMTLGGITLVYDSGQPVGTVLSQTPAGGQTQPLGTAINLSVAGIDVIAPTPNPATFAVAPLAINSSSITMTATTGTDPSGVQYLFTETSGNPGASSSVWQDSPVFTDTGLSGATTYSYTVTLRDKAAAANATAASSPSSVTTTSIPAAQLWYWDGGTADIPTNGNGASAGGTGTWDTTLRNWDGGNVAHTEWNNSAGKTAVFGGTAGTVTIGGGGVTVGDMQLTSATYTINGAPLTINGTSNLQINVAANIQSVLTGSFGLTKAGTGTLTLSGANNYTGTTTVSGGILTGSINNFLPANSNININTGGTFRYAAGGNFNAHNLALNGGILALDGGNSTFGTLAVNANSTIDGSNSNFQTNTINASITGVGGLTKTNGGTIRLNGTTNNYNGPTAINAGALLVKSSLYGNNTSQWTPANITVANNAVFSMNVGGSGDFNVGQASTMFTKLTTNVNNNGMRPGSFMCVDTRNLSSGTTTYSTVLADSTGTGGGAVNFKFFGSSTTELELTGANTYTGLTMIENSGTLRVSSFNSVATNPGLGTVRSTSSSLGAPTTVANGTIWLGAGGYNGNSHPGTTYQGGNLTYTGTGETTDRVLNIGGANGSNYRIDQSGIGLLKFVSNITATEGRGPKNFILQGSTNGQGEFACVIPNVQTTAPLTLAKSGTGTWTLSAANLFTGLTTLNSGSLVLANANALAGGIGSTGGLGALTFNGGVIGLGAGDFARPLAAAGTIGAVTFTGAGGWAAYGANRAVNLGGASAAITWATAGTGLNAQILILGNQTATHTVDFQNPLNLGNAARTVRMDDGTAAIDGILSGVLSGAGGGLTKAGFGTLVLSNANTYTGATSLNQGTLLIEGNNTAATGTTTVAAGAKLGGRGTVSGNITVASSGGLTFDLSTPAANHDRLDLASGKTLTFTGSTSITITSLGGATFGTYTLVSGGNNIVSTILPSLIMPQGWNAVLSIAGNQLLLTVSSTVNDAPVWASNPVVGSNALEDANYTGTLTGSASDADLGDVLTFAKLSGPAWLAVAPDGTLSGTPANSNFGTNLFTVSVSDGIAPPVEASLSITVNNTNDAPVWSGNPLNAPDTLEDALYNINLATEAADIDPGASLAFAKISGPAWLNVAADGTVSGIPSNGDVGPNSFTIAVSDGIAAPVETVLNITVFNTNDAPVWASNPVSGANATEDAAYSGSIAGNASDVDAGSSLTFAKVSGPAWLNVAANGALSGTPDNSNVGVNSFTVSVSDGIATSVNTTLNVTVINTNDAPTWTSNPFNRPDASEDAVYSANIASFANDVDAGATLTFAKVSGPAWLTVASNGDLSGTPDNSDVGANSFTVSVSDGIATAVQATLNITVTNTNDAPTWAANPITGSDATEDAAYSGSLAGSASDVDAGATLAYAKTGGTAWLSVASDGTLSGTPTNSDVGSSSFTVSVSDGTAPAVSAQINITVINTNDVPVAVAQNVSTDEDTALPITLTGTDVDDNPLTYTVVSAPSNGALSGTAPNLSYTPASNYNGSDSFTFKVNDGTINSATATVSITVTAVNDAPVAVAQSVTTVEDTTKAITLTGTDVELDALTYTIVTPPTNGTLSGTAPNVIYTPTTNSNEADGFTFKVNDGTVDSAVATVLITVTEINDIPVASAQSVSTAEDTAKTITLAGTDVEGGVLTYEIVASPTHGALSGTAPDVIYTPSANYNGPDSFTFKVNDGTLESVEATVDITVTAVNDVPVAVAQSVSTAEDTAKAITLQGADVENGVLTYTIVTPPENGTLSGTAPNVTYTPTTNYNGPDSFTFKVNDGTLDSATATVSITVTAVNDAPVAVVQSLTTDEDTALPITLAGTDFENSVLTYTVVTPPANGTLSGTAPNVIYTPAANYSGADSFTFVVNDGSLDSATATVSITVNPINDAPVAVAQSVTTAEDTALSITLVGTDAENGALTYTIVTQPASGTLSGTAPNVTYTPAANYNGAASFTFKVNDGTIDSATATVSITVTAVNDAPVFTTNPIIGAGATESIAYTSQTLAGKATDADAGDTITYSKISGPAWLAVASNGTLSGTPSLGSAGLNSFVVRATDSTSATTDATLQITVTGLPLPWVTGDIGTGQLAGLATFNAGTFTQAGSGIIGSTTDKLRFTYQTLTGDGEIIAKISVLQNTGTASRVGVMIRDTLATNSKEIFMGMTSTNAYRWARRTTTGGSTTTSNSSTGTVPNTWVRLVRSGTTITAYKSTNGTTWTSVGSTTGTTFASTCYIGLAVGSGTDTTLNTSQFSNLSVTP